MPALPALGGTAAAAPRASAKKRRAMHPNLHLAILDALAEAGEVKLPRLEPKNPYRPDTAVRKKLLGLKPRPAALKRLQSLTWDAGQDIQFLEWGQWHGEDDHFHVEWLDGIEALSGLEELELSSVDDLAPLKALKGLRRVTIDGQVADLSPLLDLPKLRSASVSGDPTAANKKVLAARGLR